MKKNELQAELKRKDYTYETVSKELGISSNAFARKMIGMNDFTLTEVRGMVDTLELTQQKLIDIFFS